MTNSSFVEEVPSVICGITLRPFTLGTMQACRALELSLFTDSEKSESISDEEKQFQVCALAWMQSEDLAVVKKAIRDGSARDRISDFMWDVPIDGVQKFADEIQRISKMAGDRAVEVVPRPGGKSEDGQPPN